AIPLSPLGSYDRKLPVTLSWQVRASSAIEGATTTIAFHRLDRRGGEAPALEVSISGRLNPGINLVQRELGVDQLEAGGYRIELAVTLLDGQLITRSAPMV